jgi:hypothetical protein
MPLKWSVKQQTLIDRYHSFHRLRKPLGRIEVWRYSVLNLGTRRGEGSASRPGHQYLIYLYKYRIVVMQRETNILINSKGFVCIWSNSIWHNQANNWFCSREFFYSDFSTSLVEFLQSCLIKNGYVGPPCNWTIFRYAETLWECGELWQKIFRPLKERDV